MAEIVIKPARGGTTNTNRPGIVVPGPADSGFRGTRQKPQVLDLLNGDQLQGTFVEFQLDTGVTWRHPASKDDIKLAVDSLSRISLHPRGTINLPAAQNCTIKLRTGDELMGQLVELNERYVILNAWYCHNSLRIPRNKVLSIHPGAKTGSAIFEGPNGLEGWSQSGGNARGQLLPNGRVLRAGLFPKGLVPGGRGAGWQFANKSFVSFSAGAQIGRQFKALPESVNVEFDLSWTGNPGLSLYLFSDRLEQHSGNAYIININSSASCMRMRNSSQSSLGNQNLSVRLRGKSKARFSVCANRKTRVISLVIDGQLVKEWKDTTTTGIQGEGKGVMFVSQGSGSQRISKLRILKWDGDVPKAGSAAKSASDQDVVVSANGSQTTGVLHGVSGGRVKFTSGSLGELNIDINKVDKIRLANAKPEKRVVEIGDVRGTFVTGGEMIFRLERWTADRVTGMHSSFGKVNFDPAVFSTLELNLNKQRGDNSGGF